MISVSINIYVYNREEWKHTTVPVLQWCRRVQGTRENEHKQEQFKFSTFWFYTGVVFRAQVWTEGLWAGTGQGFICACDFFLNFSILFLREILELGSQIVFQDQNRQKFWQGNRV